MEEPKAEEVHVEEEVAIDPLLELQQLIFEYTSNYDGNAAELKETILSKITAGNMAPFYEYVCAQLKWSKDAALLTKMQQANAESLAKLDEKKKDAEENQGETEEHDVMLEVVQHYHSIGDQEKCLSATAEIFDKVKGVGKQLDLLFMKIRLGLVYNEITQVTENIEKAQNILKKEGDWERRNRLKVYQGLSCIIVRDFKKAATVFLESVATFSSSEIMNFKQFIFYTVLTGIPTLSRPDLKTKVVENSEVLSVMPELKDIDALMKSIYYCKYDSFFANLDVVCEKMRRNMYLARHVNYYYREVRILAFKQYLSSYRSVTMEKMAKAFAISPELLDSQLSTFIAANRVACKIDKVGNQVITNRYDVKNANYLELLKNGDLLLNKLQKLARIVGT